MNTVIQHRGRSKEQIRAMYSACQLAVISSGRENIPCTADATERLCQDFRKYLGCSDHELI